ncbi:MAG: hypothetical protein ABII26_01085 [Pseudomonadota bacterium]
MKDRRHKIFSLTILVIFSLPLFLSRCASGPEPVESILDSPESHVFNGFKFIKKNRMEDAMREFDRALIHNSQNSPANRGLGLVYGIRGEFRTAFESMGRALENAKKDEDKAYAYVGFMRLHIMKKGEGWLKEVEGFFQLADSIMKDITEGYYYLGLAYKYGYQFTLAEKNFKKVLAIDQSFVTEAQEQIKILKKIEKATPLSEFGRKLVVKDSITKAEAAALFINELGLDRIYENIVPKTYLPITTPVDAIDHPLRKDIERVLQMNIEGLRPFLDGTFGPDSPVTRANFAMMTADIIATVEKNPSLTTEYFGKISPFMDIRNDTIYFNAIMICTERNGIMGPANGFFAPMVRVSGVDAVLIIKKLKQSLK